MHWRGLLGHHCLFYRAFVKPLGRPALDKYRIQEIECPAEASIRILGGTYEYEARSAPRRSAVLLAILLLGLLATSVFAQDPTERLDPELREKIKQSQPRDRIPVFHPFSKTRLRAGFREAIRRAREGGPKEPDDSLAEELIGFDLRGIPGNDRETRPRSSYPDGTEVLARQRIGGRFHGSCPFGDGFLAGGGPDLLEDRKARRLHQEGQEVGEACRSSAVRLPWAGKGLSSSMARN